ncbi:MAG: NAD-dependent epimerase/dehydratase family protein [Chloroflexota bacterium]
MRTNLFRDEPHVEKILAERILFGELRLPGTILRYPMVYGPNDGGRIMDPLTRMNDGRPAIILDERMTSWRWSRGYAENVAHATVLAVVNDRAAGRIYNVAEPEALSMTEWIKAIGRATGWRGETVPLPHDQLPAHLQTPNHWDQDWVVDRREFVRNCATERTSQSRNRCVARWSGG